MKATEIRGLAETEIADKLKERRTELFNLRFQLATGQLDNPHRINVGKTDIARRHTELRAREIAAAKTQA
jgi:large subunit ribosomal protein L29